MPTYGDALRRLNVRLGLGSSNIRVGQTLTPHGDLLCEFVSQAEHYLNLRLSEKRDRQFIYIPYSSERVQQAEGSSSEADSALDYRVVEDVPHQSMFAVTGDKDAPGSMKLWEFNTNTRRFDRILEDASIESPLRPASLAVDENYFYVGMAAIGPASASMIRRINRSSGEVGNMNITFQSIAEAITSVLTDIAAWNSIAVAGLTCLNGRLYALCDLVSQTSLSQGLMIAEIDISGESSEDLTDRRSVISIARGSTFTAGRAMSLFSRGGGLFAVLRSAGNSGGSVHRIEFSSTGTPSIARISQYRSIPVLAGVGQESIPGGGLTFFDGRLLYYNDADGQDNLVTLLVPDDVYASSPQVGYDLTSFAPRPFQGDGDDGTGVNVTGLATYGFSVPTLRHELDPKYITGLEFSWDERRTYWSTLQEGLPDAPQWDYASIPLWYELRDRLLVYPKPSQAGVFRVHYEDRTSTLDDLSPGQIYDSEVSRDMNLLLAVSEAMAKRHFNMPDVDTSEARAEQLVKAHAGHGRARGWYHPSGQSVGNRPNSNFDTIEPPGE